MKTKIATAIFSLAACLGFSDEAPISQPSATLPLDLKAVQKPALKQSFGYVRMGVADSDAINSFQTLPGLGLGYRYGMSQSAIDVSANYTREAKTDHENYTYTAPRVSYLRYVSNDVAPQSFYYGAGLAWGAVKKGAADDFQGILGSATIGYEMNRNQNWHSFVQLDVSQPAVAVSSTTSYSLQKAWKPLAEVSVGLGF